MKNKYLFHLIVLFTIKTVCAQINTSPTDTTSPVFLNEDVYIGGYKSHIFINNKHYFGKSPVSTGSFQDSFLTIYDSNLNLETSIQIPNYKGVPSQSFTSGIYKEEMASNDNSVYFFAHVDETELCLYRLDTGAEIIDEANRLSLKSSLISPIGDTSTGALVDVVSSDNKVFVLVNGWSPNFNVAMGANWSNPLATYDTSSNQTQTFLFMLDSDMTNPILLHHFKGATFNYQTSDISMSILSNGNLLIPFLKSSGSGEDYLDTVYVELNTITGDIVRTKSFDGPALLNQDKYTGNFLLSLPSFNYGPLGGDTEIFRNIIYVLDSNWNELYNSGNISDYRTTTSFKVIVTENSYIVLCGQQRLYSNENNPSWTQTWQYIHMKKNLQRMVIHSGEKIEYYWGFYQDMYRFQRYNLDEDGYDAIGFYNDVPLYTTGGGVYQVVSVGGTQLPANVGQETKTFKYHRNTSIPSETFTPQLGNNGVTVYMNKKIENNSLTDSDEFDSVLTIDNSIDTNTWVGSIIDPSYITGGEATGWSVWANYALYGLGNVQVNDKGDLFVDIAMYDWTDFIDFFYLAPVITRTKLQRIYLINESQLSLDDLMLNEIMIYPNPTTGIVQIKLPNSIILKSINIYDIQGKHIETFKNHRIDMRKFSKGMYFLKINTDKGSISKKVLKQ